MTATPSPTDRSAVPVASLFCDALRELEQHHRLDPLVALYASGCVVSGASSVAFHRGPDGARAYWDEYRRSFREMTTRFVAVVDGGDHVAIEWETDATVEGLAVHYGGVTMLEVCDGLVTRSRAYFDTRELGRHLTKASPAEGGVNPSTPAQGSPGGGYVP